MSESRSYIKEATSREKVLGSIRNALVDASDMPNRNVDHDAPDFVPKDDDLAIAFATTLVAHGGYFIYCVDEDDFLRLFYLFIKDTLGQTPVVHETGLADLLTDARIPFHTTNESAEYSLLSSCEALVANTGEILFSQEVSNDLVQAHAFVAYCSQLSIDRKTALRVAKQTYGEMFPSVLRFLKVPTASEETSMDNNLTKYYVFFIDNK